MFGYKEPWLPPNNVISSGHVGVVFKTVHSNSFSKHPCWLLSFLSSLFRRFIESQLFCLPEFHPLVIRNESHLRSISSPPSRHLQTGAAAHRSAPDFSHASNSPTPVDAGEPHPWQWQGINRQELPWYLLQTLLPSRAVSPYLWNAPTTPLSSRKITFSNPDCIGTTQKQLQFLLYSPMLGYALIPFLQVTWIIGW